MPTGLSADISIARDPMVYMKLSVSSPPQATQYWTECGKGTRKEKRRSDMRMKWRLVEATMHSQRNPRQGRITAG